MRALILACSVLFVSTLIATPAQCQDDASSSQAANHDAVEGTVVTSTRNTLVVRTDDNQYYSHTATAQCGQDRSRQAHARG